MLSLPTPMAPAISRPHAAEMPEVQLNELEPGEGAPARQAEESQSPARLTYQPVGGDVGTADEGTSIKPPPNLLVVPTVSAIAP